ncbi:hypothetical protein TWF718_001273 [Orbilia javanica]|uniref:MYND-type domain-containing protein n=1 Tax=Orbilia javanica TaxID=47235 RepID=A0AAN8P2E4_9PEZI
MPIKQLQPTCKTCGSSSNLFNCGRCSAVQYCSIDHQTEDSKKHLPTCSRIWERLSPLQQCDKLSLNDIISEDSAITNSIPVDDLYPVTHRHGTVQDVDLSLRVSLIKICIGQNTYASLKLATHQIRMLGRYRLVSQLIFVPTLLRTGADEICYRLLSLERRFSANVKANGDRDVALRQLHQGVQDVMEKKFELGDIFEDLRHWVFWSPMPYPRSMAALVFVLQTWIDDLEDAVQFDCTIAKFLRRRLNYDTVEIIRGYLFKTEAMMGNRKVLQDRARRALRELRGHQEYILRASCYSHREFWEQLMLGMKMGVLCGHVGTSRGGGATIGFPNGSTGYTLEDLSVFRRILLDHSSALQFLTAFFEREPIYLKGPSAGSMQWLRTWQEVSRTTTARSDALENGSS